VTLIAGGESPDIINIAIEGTRLLTDRNILFHLDDIIATDPDAPELLNDLDPLLIDALRVEGRTYLIPHSWNNMVIYYNTKLFEEAGLELPTADWTWDDFLFAAQTLTKGEGEEKVWGFIIPSFHFGITPWFLTNDTYTLNDDWTDSNLKDPKIAESLQFLYDLVHVYGVAPIPEEGIDVFNLFVAERVAMFGGGRWPMNTLIANEFTDYDIQLWPRNTAATTVFGVGGWGISSRSDNQELAWELIKDLASKETMEATAAVGVAIPARRSVAESEEFLIRPPNAEIFYGSLKDARPVPSPANFAEMEEIFMRAYSNIMTGQQSIEDALAQADTELKTSFERLRQ